MSKLSFRARALDASKPMPIYLAEELPDLPDYSAINRAVPQMPSGMEKEEESEHHLQRAISGTGLIIPTPEVCEVSDLEFYERCYPPDYKMPKQHIHMQPLWEEQEAPEYDIDSEDERWLKQQRHPELTEWKFEQMMDKLEKSSGQTVVTLSEAMLLLERHDDLVTAVYDYWLNKRLTTQHPLILSVKTENRPGQSSNNPYLAFRRRTEKMQTRKNRKNDESSYEKMLKLRRDLARALTLLELVSRREAAKRELVRLTAQLVQRKYAAGDFAHTPADPPPRPQYSAVPLTANFRSYSVPYPPRAPSTPVDQPRLREKRAYKRRKYRHPAVGSAQGLREGGVGSSSEEEAPPADDGPFAFRRKPGCFYEMPTTTLCGDPLDPAKATPDTMYEHELDERNRYTLTSVNEPYLHCVGFARRRLGRGGRVILDRIRTPLDDLWPKLPFRFEDSTIERLRRAEEVDFETKAHRTPKELTRDYHTSGKYPWRHAFRHHLHKNPHLWTDDPDITQTDKLKMDIDIKLEPDEFRNGLEDLKNGQNGPEELTNKPDEFSNGPDEIRNGSDLFKSEPECSEDMDTADCRNGTEVSSVKCIGDSARTIDESVRSSLQRVLRKRTFSGCSVDSYDSDESLHPVEKEFQSFFNEVNTKWLHFRPRTPSPSPPLGESMTDGHIPLSADTPLAVELTSRSPTHGLQTFTTTEFTLSDLYGDINPEDKDTSLDVNEDLLGENLGLTEAQVESMLSETDLKDLDKKMAEGILELVDEDNPFLSQGQSSEGRASSGCSRVTVRPPPTESICVPTPNVPPTTNVTQPASVTTLPNVTKSPKVTVAKPTPKVTVSLAGRVNRSIVVNATSKPSVVVSAHANAIVNANATVNAVAKVSVAAVSAVNATTGGVVIASQPERKQVEQQPVPTSKIIVEEVNEVPLQLRLDKTKRREEVVEDHLPQQQPLQQQQQQQQPQIKAATMKQSPLKKHVVTATSHQQPHIVTVAVSDSLKVRLQNHLLSTQSGVLVQNGPFPPVAVALPVQQARDSGASVSTTSSPRRVSAPLVQLAPASLSHKPLQIHAHSTSQHTPLVVTPTSIHHVSSNKLKVLHAHPLTSTQRSQLLAQNRSIAQLPTVVSLSPIADNKGGANAAALLKASPGGVTQFIEIKGASQLGKGPHLVNVVRQPQPQTIPVSGKATVTRLELAEGRRRAVLGPALGLGPAGAGPAGAAARAPRAAEPRRLLLPASPHQIQLKNRTVQLASAVGRAGDALPTSATVSAVSPAAVSAVSAVSAGARGGGLAANVQAIAFSAAPLRARHARLAAPRPPPDGEIVEASAVSTNSTGEAALDGDDENVRRRDSLPMEVT